MAKEIENSGREVDWNRLEEIIKFVKKFRARMHEYSTAGQWQDSRYLHNDLSALQPLYA